jgi:hypothetical protein
MGVNGQRHASAALSPRRKDPPVPIVQEGGPQSRSEHRLKEKSFRLCRVSNLDRSVFQSVADTILIELPQLLLRNVSLEYCDKLACAFKLVFAGAPFWGGNMCSTFILRVV